MGNCDVCNKALGEKAGFLLTTKQIVSTPAYWKTVLTHGPYKELMKAFGTSLDNPVLKQQLANMSASQKNPWVVCDECINLFDVNKDQAREYALKWYDSGKTYAPPGSGPASMSEVKMEETSGSACFIATAAFLEDSLEVEILREFKNNILVKNTIGRFFVRSYYLFSPPLANWIQQSESRRSLVRKLLFPLIKLSRNFVVTN